MKIADHTIQYKYEYWCVRFFIIFSHLYIQFMQISEVSVSIYTNRSIL